MYIRTNRATFFVLPALALGVEEPGWFFLELAWLFWSCGIDWHDETFAP